MDSQLFKSSDFFETMQKLRHEIHQYPELGFEEEKTKNLLAKILHEHNIETHSSIGKTGLVAKIQNGHSTKSIGLRSELDALPIYEKNSFLYRSKSEGKMHACGHDGHMAMLLGAALYLKKTGHFDGTVYFIFQPNEERGLGALKMIEEGLFERFPMDSVFAIHNMPNLKQGEFLIKSGPVMASEDNFEIIIQGRGGHSAFPEKSVDSILVGSQIVTALQSILSRGIPSSETVVLSVTDFETAGTPNVISDKVTLRGDVRSFNSNLQDFIEDKIKSISKGISSSFGASVEVSYKRNFIATINTEDEAQLAREAARSLLVSPKAHADHSPFMTSEDFGFMLQRKPGCYILMGNGGENLHTPHYDFNDKNLCLGTDFWISLVENALPKKG